MIGVYNPSQQMPEADAVIITILNEYKEISDLLKNNMKCPMISLEEIVQKFLFYCFD